MPPAGGKATPIEPGILDRVSGALSGAIKGAADAWFGPLQPITPVAPPETAGRQFDYPTGINLVYRPRSEGGQGGISFQTLRDLADPSAGGLDLLRGAIETRKDQMAAQKWTIRPRKDESKPNEPAPDAKLARAREIKKALLRPDGVNTFAVWQRMLLEDSLVIDAPVIYMAPGPGHRIPQVMDGALIKRLITPQGRTPLPPHPAYQQALKGLPAVDYSADELLYGVRNLRSNKIYGLSPTEQVVMTVSIALRRQVSQLEYYTAGSIPDMLASVPESWSTRQIGEFQAYWDALLSGETAERRRLRFVPGSLKPYEPKAAQLKDTFDEWLARLICWFFSLSPQALVAQMNRATAETAAESSAEEGLEPLKNWWADLIADVLVRMFPDGADYEFAYEDEEIVDAATKANVHAALVGAGIETTDEAREAYGLKARDGDRDEEGGGVDGAAAVQDTALNGAQVASLLAVVQAVTDKTMPVATGRGIIVAAFPSLDQAEIDAIVGGLEGFEKPKAPAPATFPPKGGKNPNQLDLPLDGANKGDEAEERVARRARRPAGRSLQSVEARAPDHPQGCGCDTAQGLRVARRLRY
jgi:hypothetical protein